MEADCLALKDLGGARRTMREDDGDHGDLKENVYTERRKSTPQKTPEPALPVLLMNRKPRTDVTPIKRTVLADPLTPTANLKMLISAASPDIRDREMKKVLFRPIENDKPKPASPDPSVEDAEEDYCQFEAVDEEEDVEKKPSRKQKSLGLLCQKFLALYPDYPPAQTPIWISLDEVATSLGVERRRIYDIVNVLESLTIVGRIAKNSYTWHGRQRLQATLGELQQAGRQQGYRAQLDLAGEARAGREPEDDGGDGDAATAGANRKDKSLRIMSQKFVMLFLVSRTQTVTLDAAAKILIEESQDSSSHSKYKTKVRRLYDIANVLTSLGLIKKVHVREERGRKPAFKWLGPVDFSNSGGSGSTLSVAVPEPVRAGTNQDLPGLTLPHHAVFSITPTSVSVQQQQQQQQQQQLGSAPASPTRHLTGLPNQPADYLPKNVSSSAACPLQAGHSTTPPTPLLQAQLTQSVSLPPPSPHPAPQPEHFLLSPSHCLAYLPSLSQPSVLTLYQVETPEQTPQGQRSPLLNPGGKRRSEEEEEEGPAKKNHRGLEDWDTMRVDQRREAEFAQSGNTRTLSGGPLATESPGHGGEHVQPSHYLYVPNNAGYNNLNLLISAGQQSAGVALPQSALPAMALPYILLPSATLSHYPLVQQQQQQHGSESPAKLSFSLPAMMPSAHFMVGAAPYSLGPGPGPGPGPASPEQRRLLTPAGAPRSPPGPGQTFSFSTPETQPLTPKEPLSSSKASFRTPGSLGSTGTVAAARRRGSAQRRLDVEHPAAV
ncbi:transcription factor E2F7 [Cololabis saira]|uniref:transcription factor E2F7 n=1 Tax=Cololabis saira TaxID=129043 RepID=UPI002AD280AE|nr:transcription factor E2F7 [Cololabis saira]